MIEYVILSAVLGLIVAFLLSRGLASRDDTEEAEEITKAIRDGAMTFLKTEYKVLVVFVVVLFCVLVLVLGTGIALAFLAGAILSAVAGNIGMRVATSSNTKTANACKTDVHEGLKIALGSGSITSLTVVGLGLLGVTLLHSLFGMGVLFGFGLGASSIALFARVGGGIYTKAADVGADLVGKVEKGIPEDDPRNPATIADNVGDNVGDVAGMGADLFESYVDAIIAAIILGAAVNIATGSLYPLGLAGGGIIASIIALFFVRGKRLSSALNNSIFASAILTIIFAYIVTVLLGAGMNVFYSATAGIIIGVAIGLLTEYYTSAKHKPTQSVAKAAQTGAGTNVIAGLSVGMRSTIVPVIIIAGGIVLAYQLAGLYGIAIAAVGMLSTLGTTLAADSYGPVADNAAGIAEMAGLGKEVRERAEELDAIGNTTAAIGKGFAIGSAVLTSLALFVAYTSVTSLTSISITEPYVMAGLLIGALMPFVLSSLTMSSVGKAAMEIVEEVRRQFKDKDIMSGKTKPDYERCITISTNAAIKEMIVPAVLAIVVPLVIGFVLGAAALGGFLAGAIATGFLLAITLANAGGSWDNAKKYIEAGNLGGKGSDAHKAAVVGDTVGDPAKDTSGPSLNILLKLMSIVALVFAPLLI
jgi:K(+)-stimulated pyrophosphate-energized sodium pump